MSVYVGDAVTELFSTTTAGETFVRTASFIGGVSTVWNPTFFDLGGGTYRWSYVPAVPGAHSWVGAAGSDQLILNFDVDAAAPLAASITSAVPIAGAIAGARIGLNDLVIPQGVDWTLPMFWFAGASKIDTTGYAAILTARPSAGATPALTLSTAAGTLATGFDPPKWQVATPYAYGQRVVPTVLNGRIYRATVAGTSGAGEPTWPTAIGDAVADGGAVWLSTDDDTATSNLRIQLVPASTLALAPFGAYPYDLIWQDPFGKWTRILAGYLTLAANMSTPS